MNATIIPETLQVPRQRWLNEAQPWEQNFWCEYQPMDTGALISQSQAIWERFGFSQDEFAGKEVLDIGCGPTARVAWLKGVFIGMDPLAVFYEQSPAARMERYALLYNWEAERRLPGWVGRFDAVLSLNALDHGYDFPLCLSNIHEYLKPGGFAFLSLDVDKRDLYDAGHLLRLNHDTVTRLLLETGFDITRIDHGGCLHDDGEWKDSWGGGVAYHWWLLKPEGNDS